jgi:outer membrane receptor for ferrienterochelin and colicins
LRYDANTIYGGRLNPTAGLSYQPWKWLGIKTSLGTGYKSPTYRQLYQRFTNLSQGYTVLGTDNIQDIIELMKADGEIKETWAIASQIRDLRPETSLSWNTQLSIRPWKNVELSGNLFYNSIRNLITSQQIGIKGNGSQLFSWFNIASMHSKGLEASLSWQPLKALSLTAGYQYLDMKDLTILDSIKNSRGAFASVREPSMIMPAQISDYFGLPGRSKHMANLQLSYAYTRLGLHLSLRGSYRGKYGFLDVDNNGYIDNYDVFVRSYFLINGAVQKHLMNNQLTIRLTVDNIASYTDYLMPAQPGRMILAGLSWNWIKKSN